MRADRRLASWSPVLYAFLITISVSASASALADGATIVAQSGDASIAHDAPAGTWTIAAGGAALTLGLDPSRDFEVVRLATASNVAWTIGFVPDTSLVIDGVTLPLGNRAAGFTYQSAAADANGRTLRLDAVFDLPKAGLRVTRHYSVTSGSPTFETWTTYASLGNDVTLANLNAVQLTVPEGTLHWLTGLRGDNAVVRQEAFTLQRKRLAVGERLTLGAEGRSSEQTVPWLTIDGEQDEFYAALMWSGGWSLNAERSIGGLSLSLGLSSMTTTVTKGGVDGPHVLFGVVTGGLPQATGALRSYVLDGVRAGRPLVPPVLYNTWFAYGTDIDEEAMRNEMENAAVMGVELFVIDAGWYAGSGAGGRWDFESGLGVWQPDPARFPEGLQPLTDYAHSLGMKFGIWVEPERIDLTIIARAGADERWLATTNGSYGSDRAAQICLAGDAARRWVLDRLTALIETVRPDYLKWDNNFWINCDRAGHGHGARDGNFAHVGALYQVFAALRTRYPSLVIENVSGGGNRLDLGMLRYSDVAWMDDRTAPSVLVRHNIEGLSALFPPAYLLSFLTDNATERLQNADDMRLYVRSRMVGALGLSFRSDNLNEGDVAVLASEIDVYRAMRETTAVASGMLLTSQAGSDGGPAWDVLQESTDDRKQVLLAAFQFDPSVDRINVKPMALLPGASYEVRSVDTGLLGTATGLELMSNGIDVLQSPVTAAHIIFIVKK